MNKHNPKKPAKKRRRGGTHKKFAKGTGGYGPIDDEIRIRVPTELNESMGKIASAKGKSKEAYARTCFLEGIDRDKNILIARGGRPPSCIDLIRWTPWHLNISLGG